MTGHALLDRTSPSNIWWFSVDVLFMKTKAEVSPFFFKKKGGMVQVQASLETMIVSSSDLAYVCPCAWHELGRNGCIELNVHTMSYRKAEIFVFSLPRTEQMHDTYLIAYYKQDGYIYYIKAYLMSYRNIVPNNQYT